MTAKEKLLELVIKNTSNVLSQLNGEDSDDQEILDPKSDLIAKFIEKNDFGCKKETVAKLVGLIIDKPIKIKTIKEKNTIDRINFVALHCLSDVELDILDRQDYAEIVKNDIFITGNNEGTDVLFGFGLVAFGFAKKRKSFVLITDADAAMPGEFGDINGDDRDWEIVKDFTNLEKAFELYSEDICRDILDAHQISY